MCLGAPALAQEGVASTSSDTMPTHREQLDHYLWSTFGPPELIGDTLSSGVEQWRDVPHKWGRSTRAYAKRFGAEYAETAVGNTTKYLLARMLDEDPSFRRCECTGLVPRLRHASLAPLMARKADGRTVFSMARITGVTTGNVVAAIAWSPTPQGAHGIVQHVAADVAGTIGADLLREFVKGRKWR
jgi:hypothetical protein